MEGIDKKEMAADAKKRGNAFFAKKTEAAYKDALAAYDEAIELDPTNHVCVQHFLLFFYRCWGQE